MTDQLLDHTLGNLASRIPGATQVFHTFHLDFCCDGQKTLRQAALENDLDAWLVEEHLLALTQDELPLCDWQQASNAQLIEHLLERYHAVHRQQLPELIRLAARVEQVHRAREHCPRGLTDVLLTLQQELENHMHKEEHVLFPMIKQDSHPLVAGAISAMRFEHVQYADALEKIIMLTNDMQPPAGACNTWRALYRGLDELGINLMQNIHLENNLLFPRALEDGVEERQR